MIAEAWHVGGNVTNPAHAKKALTRLHIPIRFELTASQ